MKITGVIALLLMTGCESLPESVGGSARKGGSQSVNTGSEVRYECYTYVGSKHVLTLPVAPLDSPISTVNVTFLGDRIEAIYVRRGLTQSWMFDDRIFVELDPDLTAAYYDFTGAEQGEQRKPEAVFECKKRG